MSNGEEELFGDGPEPAIDIIAGREAPPHTPIQDWVALSGASDAAVSLYGKLKMHVNRQRGDAVVWPGTLSLAFLMNRPRGDKISPYLKELAALGAIDIQTPQKMPRRHVYVVHDLPPEGYTGPLSLKEWYRRNRPAIDAAAAREKAARDARAEKKDKAKKEQVSPVAPDSGEQDFGTAVAPKSGQHVAPEPGEHVAPEPGGELRSKEPERTEPPLPPATSEAGAAAAGREGEEPFQEMSNPDIGTAVAWVMDTPAVVALAVKNSGWRHPTVARTLAEAVEKGLGDLQTCAMTLVLLAENPDRFDKTWSARRLLESGPWWAPAAAGPPAVPPQPGPRCEKSGHERQPADACKLCLSEEKGGDRGQPAAGQPMSGAAARALAQQIAADAGRKASADRAPARVS